MNYFFFNETATTEIHTDGHTLSLHDALPILNGILFQGLSLLQRLHEGFEGVAHRRRNAGRPAIATQRGDLDDETRKLLAGAPDLLHRVQPGAAERGEARAHLDEIVEVRRPEIGRAHV